MRIERLSEDFWRISGADRRVEAPDGEVVFGLDEMGIFGAEPALGQGETDAAPIGRVRRVPVHFSESQDAARVCRHLGIPFDRLVKAFCRPGKVLALGFQAGFAYVELPDELQGVSRLDSPRTRVAAGSVGLAHGTWGIYPAEVPGGWNLIGRCPRKVVDVERGYFPIRAGDILAPYPAEPDDSAVWLLPVDLNVDLGEGYPWDEALMNLATSVNICMGAHAGSSDLTRDRLRQGRAAGLRCVAHPGYPDRESMGRRRGADAGWIASVRHQVTEAFELGFDAIKPHGALYHDLLDEAHPIYGPFTKWLGASRLPLVGLRGSRHSEIAHLAGVRFVEEGFVERGYGSDGRLIPRGDQGAELHTTDEIGRQAVRLAEQATETLCVHGDRLGCVEILRATRQALVGAGFEVGTWS